MEASLPAGWDLWIASTLLADRHGPTCTGRSPGGTRVSALLPLSLADFDTMLGHEIAREIAVSHAEGRPLVLILPVGPMGMYR